MQRVESLVNRVCSLQCDMLCMDEQFESVDFTFMLWDHTVHNVKMGYVGGGSELQFVLRYDSPVNGRRLFVGVPWLADCVHHEHGRVPATPDMIDPFLAQAGCCKRLQTNVVFDGTLTVDKPVSLHLQLDLKIRDKTLLVKDVAECNNILLVIDMFE
jgi:hypothetical protein